MSGRLSWFVRQCQGQSQEDILLLAKPQLDLETATGLEHDVQLLMQLYEEPVPENDYGWIYSDVWDNLRIRQGTKWSKEPSCSSCSRWPRDSVPGTRLSSLSGRSRQRVATSTADLILLLWPLFSNSDRLAFQSWYNGGWIDELGRDDNRPEPSSSSGIRREG